MAQKTFSNRLNATLKTNHFEGYIKVDCLEQVRDFHQFLCQELVEFSMMLIENNNGSHKLCSEDNFIYNDTTHTFTLDRHGLHIVASYSPNNQLVVSVDLVYFVYEF